MIAPQWDWAAGNLKKNAALALGVVALVALGIGISVAAFSVLGVLTQDPIPARSSALFVPTIDPRPKSEAIANSSPPKLLSWIDANNLVEIGPAGQVVATAGGKAKVSVSERQYPEKMNLRYSNSAFFSAFEVPFASGAAWKSTDDQDHARYVVLSPDAANRLFGTTAAVGKRISLGDTGFTVIGITEKWSPKPRFYDLSNGGFNVQDEIYLPISTALELRLPIAANLSCWGGGWAQLGNMAAASCGWVSVWAYLPDDAARKTYLSELENYSSSQRALGRFELPTKASMQNVKEYLSSAGLITSEVVLQTYLALGLLVVCLINASALLLSLSLRRRKEFALRRALGAAQIDIATQALFEGGLIGLIAGICAALVAAIGLNLLSAQPTLYNTAINIAPATLVGAILLSVGASVVSSVLPAWISARAKPINYLNAE